MKVVGINNGEFNSSACLCDTGLLIAAAPEERFIRQKKTKWEDVGGGGKLPDHSVLPQYQLTRTALNGLCICTFDLLGPLRGALRIAFEVTGRTPHAPPLSQRYKPLRVQTLRRKRTEGSFRGTETHFSNELEK